MLPRGPGSRNRSFLGNAPCSRREDSLGSFCSSIYSLTHRILLWDSFSQVQHQLRHRNLHRYFHLAAQTQAASQKCCRLTFLASIRFSCQCDCWTQIYNLLVKRSPRPCEAELRPLVWVLHHRYFLCSLSHARHDLEVQPCSFN